MITPERALDRLRTQPSHLDALARLFVDDLLSRPMREIVEPERAASLLVEAVRAAAAEPGLASWLEARIEAAHRELDDRPGVLGELVPITVLAPLERALRRDLRPDPTLVRALVDHPSMRAVAAGILHATVLDFARSLKSAVPEAAAKVPGGGFASRLAGVAMGVASAVGSEVEARMDDRVKAWVADAIGRTIETSIKRALSPEVGDELAQWRVDVLHALMKQRIDVLGREVKKLSPKDVAADAAGLLEALAAWGSLQDALEDALSAVLERIGDQSTRSILDGSGLEDAWRPAFEAVLRDHLARVVGTDAFAGFFLGLFTPDTAAP
jgi:hypothetical protein